MFYTDEIKSLEDGIKIVRGIAYIQTTASGESSPSHSQRFQDTPPGLKALSPTFKMQVIERSQFD